MGKVDIVLYSWLSASFPGRTLNQVVLTESFQGGETLRDLFNRLNTLYPAFGKLIFNGQTQRFYSYVNFIYKGKAADAIQDLDRPLEDGDEIVFVPIYAGG